MNTVIIMQNIGKSQSHQLSNKKAIIHKCMYTQICVAKMEAIKKEMQHSEPGLLWPFVERLPKEG